MLKISITNLPALASVAASIGISVFITLFCLSEWSYDRSFDDFENIYRIEIEASELLGFPRISVTDPDLSRMLTNQVESSSAYVAASLENFRKLPIYRSQDRAILSDVANGIDGEPAIFDVFGLDILSGSKWQINRPDIAFISRSLAERTFTDSRGAIGETLYIGPDRSVVVAGVFEDLPAKSHIQFDLMTPRKEFKLPTVADFTPKDFESAPTGIRTAVIDTLTYIRVSNGSFEDTKTALHRVGTIGRRPTFSGMTLVPLSKIYFFGAETSGGVSGDRPLYLMMIGASFIFFLVAFGQLRLFIENGKSARNSRLFVFKSFGRRPAALIASYLGKASLMVIILALGAGLTVLVLSSQTRSILGIEGLLSNSWSENPIVSVLVFSFLLTFVAVLLSASVSEMRSFFSMPSQVSRKKPGHSKLSNLSLKLIIAVNFAIATVLIAAVAGTQAGIAQYLDADRGYQTENVFLIEGWNQSYGGRKTINDRDILRPIAERLKTKLGDDNVAIISPDFKSTDLGRETFSLENGERLRLQTIYASPNVFDILNMDVRGRNNALTTGLGKVTDVIVSESLAEYLKTAKQYDWSNVVLTHRSGSRLSIIGVVDDALFVDPELADPRALYIFNQEQASTLIVRDQSGGFAISGERLAGLDLGPTVKATPLSAVLEESVAEKIRKRNFLLALAIFVMSIAVMSVFYLFLLMLRRSRKEIVIRQVYGDTLLPLALHWSSRMLWPVVLGGVVGAIIVAYLPVMITSTSKLVLSLKIESIALISMSLIAIGAAVLILCLSFLCRKIDISVLREEELNA